jgi:hypothetical protein
LLYIVKIENKGAYKNTMQKRVLENLFALFLFIAGTFFIIFSGPSITGAAIGVSNTGLSLVTFAGLMFMLGAATIVAGNKDNKNLEKRLEVKNTILQKRKDDYYIINTQNGESYSLEEIGKLAKEGNELKSLLRKEYFSDLLRAYVKSKGHEKAIYKRFIEALSPNTNQKHLETRLKQFENVYKKIEDKIEYMNPKRIERARGGDFDETMYARFENEKETLWPEENSIGFLPFDEVRVNPARGPLLSIVPLKKLIADGYLLKDLKLNPKWSKQKRQDYLRDEYGIDVGSRQRNMILFQIERGAKIEKYNNYENIVIEDKVPLVKVNYKK